MKFLVIGDHDFGQRDRETDLIHRVLSMELHGNAKRNEDDLNVYADDHSYLGSVVEEICEVYDEPIVYEEHPSWPQASPGPTETNLVLAGRGDPLKFLEDFDPEMDFVGCFSDDPVNCDDVAIVRAAYELAFDRIDLTPAEGKPPPSPHAFVAFVHSQFGSFETPPELLPVEVTWAEGGGPRALIGDDPYKLT